MTALNEELYSEKTLMQLSSKGEEKAFIKLFYLYRHRLYSFALRITGSPELAQDMVQDVFFKLWKERIHLDKLENFGSFIFRMAQNQAANAFKRMANETLILAVIEKERPVYETGSEEYVEYKEVQHLVNDILKKLPPQQNLVFKLSREHGLKYDEIALILKISPYTVKNHLAHARRTIREYLHSNLEINSLP